MGWGDVLEESLEDWGDDSVGRKCTMHVYGAEFESLEITKTQEQVSVIPALLW